VGHQLDQFERFVEILKTGGPWTMLAIMIILYWLKDRELGRTYHKLIDMGQVQAGLTAKVQLTMASLEGTLRTFLLEERRD